MGGPIEFFLDSGTQHIWPSLGKNYQFYPLIFPTTKHQSKNRAKNHKKCALGHFGQRVDESPMYEDDFGVS